MLPMKALRTALGSLLAADVPLLAPVAANEIALIAANFTPNENMVTGDLTFATFTGSTPIPGAAGAQGVGFDPTTQQQKITILAPAGGWRWVCTGAPSPAQVIYGFALTKTAGGDLLGLVKFPTPISISTVGQEIDLGAVEITFVLTPMS